MKCTALVVSALICGACAQPAWATTDDEAQIRNLLDDWTKAFHDRDIDRIMAIYAPDVIVFGLVPPLEYTGAERYRQDYLGFIAPYEGPIGVEFRDLHIFAGDTVAFVAGLQHNSGTLRSGEKSDLWFRVTLGFRKIDGKWRSVHEHGSVPIDFGARKALLYLTP